MISIVVPVYNSEEYIEKCILSIENQIFKDFEIIIVNDGSTDNSLEICNYLALKYNNISIISIQNSGVSNARNIGVLNARGEYIQFVDSDDMISERMSFELMNTLEKKDLDLAICGYVEVSDKKIINIASETSIFEYKDTVFFNLLNTNRLLNSPCNKLYKKKLITDTFRTDLNLGEDLVFNIMYIKNCKKIGMINESLYYYVSREGSLTTSYNSKKLKDIIELDKFFCSNGMESEYYLNFMTNLFELFSLCAKDKRMNYNGAFFQCKEIVNNEYVKKRIEKNLVGRKLSKIHIFEMIIKRNNQVSIYLFMLVFRYKVVLGRK